MFKFRTDKSHFNNFVNDIATLEDIALGYLDDEREAKRVAVIAGNMTFNDVFLADRWCLTCIEEEV